MGSMGVDYGARNSVIEERLVEYISINDTDTKMHKGLCIIFLVLKCNYLLFSIFAPKIYLLKKNYFWHYFLAIEIMN